MNSTSILLMVDDFWGSASHDDLHYIYDIYIT